MRAIQVSRFGGPEVLELVDLPAPEPTADLLRITVDAAGVNYADTHRAADDYLAPQRLPFVPGSEVVGHTPDGQRVVALVAAGYAEIALAHPASVVALPDADAVTDATALALVLQGVTAWHMLRTSAKLEKGESVLVVSAAGGVGSLAVQLARHLGAGRVIGTASTEAKRGLAQGLGADVVIGSGDNADRFASAVLEANCGEPVDVALEMTGGAVFDGALAALAPFGRLVTYGMASRTPPARIDVSRLMARSQSIIGFWLVQALRRPGGLAPAMRQLLDLHAAGGLRALHGGSYPLAEARRAHEDLRSRRTHGKLTLEMAR